MFVRIPAACRSLYPLALCTLALGAPPLTTIQDVLYKADGTRFNGLVRISWTYFEGPNSSNIPTQDKTVRIVDGHLYAQLVPTTNAVPAAYYTVLYNSDGKVQFRESWAVPPTSAKLKIKDVRTSGPLWPGGSAGASTLIQQSDVVGLVDDLATRPLKGPAFGNSRAAVINDSGQLEGATGSLSDCLRVDGTSGECGSSSGVGFGFVDAEAPSGAIDGVNASFTLADTPNPAGSLSLYRNGLRLKPALEYTLSGTTLTFVTAAIPQTGDVVLAYYRIAAAGGAAPNFSDDEAPAGTIDGSNADFSVSNAPNPASSLRIFRNGLLQREGLDYTLSGAAAHFLTPAIPQTGDALVASYRY
ncbi:MAG: hypothetical protein ACRD8O_11470 [Bryobacteraceae bacterium]